MKEFFCIMYRVCTIVVKDIFHWSHGRFVQSDYNAKSGKNGVKKGVEYIQRKDQTHGQCILIELVITAEAILVKIVGTEWEISIFF
jgi:hypothetical protein